MPILLKILPINSPTTAHTHRSLHHILPQTKKFLSNLSNTGILIREGSNEYRIRAIGVKLGVNGALREEGHLVFVDVFVSHGSSTTFENDLGSETTLDDEVEFCGPRVDVRCVEAARAEETKDH
jgi:hypothetical protein